ncbi:MAG: hypothetical protein A2X32_10125 [Elusimicrobia bacterium GWC2_64_44]|nr:MAG: hypothetical protein A2X32_10125 [Elusimicrobia bacterium GWC2_64_44]
MFKRFLLSLTLTALCQPSAFAQLSQDALQALQASAAETGGMQVPDVPADKKWGVSYVLNGALTVQNEKVFLHTADGRVFELDLSLRKARKFDGQPVRVEAKAKQADDMSVLKVSEIEAYNPAAELKLPPYLAKRRPALVLDANPAALKVANVRWQYNPYPSDQEFDWATATIKPELIKEVYFVKKPFAPEWIAAHSLLAFTFEKGGLTDANGNESQALVLTIEAFLREGQAYDLKEGLKDKFGIVWLLTTWEDYVTRTALVDQARLIPYAVKNLSHAQKADMVREAVRLAGVNREGEYYHTITNNCTNNLLIVINRVLPENRRIRMWTIPYLAYNVRATMPVMVPKYLQGKGLLGPELGVINDTNYKQPLP